MSKNEKKNKNAVEIDYLKRSAGISRFSRATEEVRTCAKETVIE